MKEGATLSVLLSLQYIVQCCAVLVGGTIGLHQGRRDNLLSTVDSPRSGRLSEWESLP